MNISAKQYVQKLVGRFKSNALVLRHRRSPRNEYDSGRLSGSLAAFKFAIYPGIKNPRSDSFRKECTPRPLLLFQKMRGWLSPRPPQSRTSATDASGSSRVRFGPSGVAVNDPGRWQGVTGEERVEGVP